MIAQHNNSDSVTRINNSPRVTIFGDSNSTRITLKKSWLNSARATFSTEWIDSSHNQWLETLVRVIFTKSLSLWWTDPVRVHTKKWTFFASVMIKVGANVLFWLSRHVMLHFKHQVSLTYTEVDLSLCFHWGVSRSQYIDTDRGLM